MDKINFVNNSEPDLSAENLNLLQTNVEKAISQVSMEIVSNSNGTAYKFKNGLMIVTQRYKAVMSGLTIQWGGVYYGHAPTPPNFPVAFIEIPVVTQMIEAKSSNAWLSSNSEVNLKTRAPKVQIVRGNSSSKEATFYIDVVAIGKWK